MEDPWGSPWTADSAPPRIDLPTPPPSAHFSLENHTQSQQRQSPERLPWEDNDPWGGWNDAGAGRASPGWRRSPALEPVASGTSSSSRQVSPGPWKLTHFDNPSRTKVQGERIEVEKEKEEEEEREGGLGHRSDSGVSLEERTRPGEATKSEPTVVASLQPTGDAPAESDSEKERQTPTKARAPSPIPEDASSSIAPSIEPEQAPNTTPRPEVARQASKVQELVEMYDGIAKRSASPAPSGFCTPPRAKKADGLTDAAARELLGIEDSEDLAEDHEATALGSGLQFQQQQKDPEVADLDENERHVVAEDKETPTPTSHTRSPIRIDIDLSKLDELFPTISLPHVEPEPVPDVIIDDTFASISERKAWYRVSRYGSTRKHNYGDEENYKGITWRTSEVRNKAIRIVRRWMEEDSIAGRVVLGRRTGPVGASMFNWDSKAPAVGIGELLAKKTKQHSHSRHASLASKTSTEARSAEPSPSVAAFGWASESFPPPTPPANERVSEYPTPVSTHASLPPPVVARTSSGQGMDAEQAARPQSLAKPPNGNVPMLALPTGTAVAQEEVDEDEDEDEDEDDDDDDDEWGEMVSSPTKDDFEDRPSSPGPDLKFEAHENDTSQGFLGNSPKSPQITPPKTTFGGTQLFPNGRASSGFDVLGEASDGSEASTPTGPTKPVTLEASQEPEKFDLDAPFPVQSSPQEGPRHAEAAYNAESGDEDDAEAVTDMLRNLPDLTYMLR